MLEFFTSVLLGSTFWVVVGTLISMRFKEGSKWREYFAGLAAFGAFCFLAAAAGGTLYVIWAVFVRSA